MTTLDIKCNGINMEKLADPIIARKNFAFFEGAINTLREKFLKDHATEFSGRFNTGKYTNGVRFRSNEDVLIRVVSACPTLEAFNENPEGWLLAGLEECAAADYWYTWEKDYGTEVVRDDEGDE